MTALPRTTDKPSGNAARDQYVAEFQRRAIQDALLSASAAYWDRRAAQFAAVGNARCDETATACRNAAAYWRYMATGELA